MNSRSLLAVFCIASACLFIAAPAKAQSSKKKPKEIVVVGSKVKDVVRDPGTTEETSLTPPALDDRNFKDLDSEKKKDKKSKESGNSSSSRDAKPTPERSSGTGKPARKKRPSRAKQKQAPETEEE